MKERSFYIAVWGVLVLATLLEVATRSIQAAAIVVAFGIIIISVTKAVLIASIYQHLWYEGKVLSLLPAAALFALTLLLLTAIMGVM